MDRFVEGDPVARAIIEAWNPSESLTRRQAVVHVHERRRSASSRPIEGAAILNADLDALLAEWRRTRSAKDYDTLLLSARPYLENVCRAIVRSSDFTELYAKLEDVLLVVLAAPEVISDLRSYLRAAAANIHNETLRGLYTGKGNGDLKMPRFIPLSVLDTLITDEQSESWRDAHVSTISDPAVATVAQMLQDGAKLTEVCAALGISLSGLRKRVSRYQAASGVVDLNARADDGLHTVQLKVEGAELHSVQSEGDTKLFSETLSTFPAFYRLYLEGEIHPHSFAAL